MSTIGERLRAHWLTQGIKPAPGVAEDRLREFETRFGVSLPFDFRTYFLEIDGMGSRDESDDDWFSFWPLKEVVQCSDEYPEPFRFIEEQSAYFVFADHSICLPAYAIRLTPSGTDSHKVIAIESDSREYSTSVVALSFSEFVERYLTDETSRFCLSLGTPITTEPGPDQTESRAATLKWFVEEIDRTLSTLTRFESLPGGDILNAQLGITRERISEIKKKAVEELRSPKPHTFRKEPRDD
ncbi:MAG: SMI1/KNR4 family protein [Isosphaerales bacterium]